MIVAVIIVRFIYYPQKQSKNYVFTFLAFNTAIYFVMSVLTNAEISIGVGFGLFGLFSLLCYRTNTMPTREMTYLFISIALPVFNSILILNEAWPSLMLANLAILATLNILERGWGFHYEGSQRLTYERIELIRPETYELMLDDLRARAGLDITHFEVDGINFLSDTADVKIYFEEPQTSGGTFPWLEAGLEKVVERGFFDNRGDEDSDY